MRIKLIKIEPYFQERFSLPSETYAIRLDGTKFLVLETGHILSAICVDVVRNPIAYLKCLWKTLTIKGEPKRRWLENS